MTFRHWWWRRDIQIVIKSGLSDSDRVVTTTLRQRYTRDVHNVTSPVVPFVNCVSHIVNTCTRRNFNFYPKKCIDVISHVVVWYDWKYEVTNCAWKKKGSQSWAVSLFLLFFFNPHMWNWETIAWKSMLILAHVYTAKCVSQCTVRRWAEGFRAGKVRVVQFRSWTSKLCFSWRKLSQKIHAITVREIRRSCDVSVGTARR